MQQATRLDDAEASCRMLLDRGDAPTEEARTLLGVILLQLGRQEEGRALIEAAAATEPVTAAGASDLGAGLILTGDLDRAVEVLERAVALPEADAAAFSRLGVARLKQGNLEEAERLLGEAALRRPDWAAPHSNLAGVMLRQEKPEAALVHYERALALQPDLAPAKRGRDTALVLLDRTGEAITRLERDIEVEPDSVANRRRLARVLATDERYQEAEEHLRDAAERAPDDASITLELASLLQIQDRHAAALQLLEQALERSPDNVLMLSALARACVDVGAFRRAEEHVEKGLALEPEAPALFVTRASIRSESGDYAAAEADLRAAIERHPGDAAAWGTLGHTLMWTGRIEEAVDCFHRAAEMNPGALAALVEARAFPDDPAVIDRMVEFADNRLVPALARSSMSFALVKLFERQDDHATAFDHADRANAIQRRTIDHNAAVQSAKIDSIVQTFTPALFREHAGKGWTDEQRPVFVCGMPRSGTTLTEQVLASHSDVHGAGELGIIAGITRLMPKVLGADAPYPACMSSFYERTAQHAGGSYLKAIRWLDDTAARVVDKLPHNFLHLGLIALIFPRARIIHVRRDPRDVALSNYFTNFKAKRGLSYAFDLAEIGHMINDHDRIMAHWREVLPMPIFDLRYEDLIADQEGTTRKLLRFVGLDWDDRVLDFHQTERAVKTASVWQVRQPIYTTPREKWRHYAEFLGPLDEVLADGHAAAAE